MDLFHNVLLEAKVSISAWGGKLVVVYLPERYRYSHPALADRDYERVLEVLRGLEIPVIDITQTFAAHEDPLTLFPFHFAWHYTPEGNQLVAEGVLRFINESGVLTR